MRAVLVLCLMLLCAACDHVGGMPGRMGSPGPTADADDIDAFFLPLIEAAIAREAGQANRCPNMPGALPDERVGGRIDEMYIDILRESRPPISIAGPPGQ